MQVSAIFDPLLQNLKSNFFWNQNDISAESIGFFVIHLSGIQLNLTKQFVPEINKDLNFRISSGNLISHPFLNASDSRMEPQHFNLQFFNLQLILSKFKKDVFGSLPYDLLCRNTQCKCKVTPYFSCLKGTYISTSLSNLFVPYVFQ